MNAKPTRSKPLALCGQPVNGDPCWRLQGHHGNHVSQRYAVPLGRPLAVVSAGGVLVASYQAFQISTAQAYVRNSGGHIVNIKTDLVLGGTS